MARMYGSGKWKKRWALGLSISMAAVLSLGVFAACKTTDEEEEPKAEESAAMPTDTQLLKNGNFEFYSEMTKEEDELRAILNTPSSWSFSSGSPSSDTKSGLIDLDYWESITGSKHVFDSVEDAYTNWSEGSIYDRLNFFYKCDNPSHNTEYDAFKTAYDALATDSEEKAFFNEQAFSSVDFEDVQYLRDELGEGADKTVPLHDDTADKKKEERGILMIHNRRTSDGAVGTAQSYSSSTTLTLKAGTSAKISVWVKTAQLRHYYSDLKEENADLDGLKVTSEAGAYIGVSQTVGGTNLDQMQIKNINTEVTNTAGDNNGWEQYTVYVRASTFATTTVRLVLGLGQGNSDDRYEAVNGYALFDDVSCEIIDNDAYAAATGSLGGNYACDVNSKKKAKLFDATEFYNNKAENLPGYEDYDNTFAIDLYAGFSPAALNLDPDKDFGLTEEKSGNRTYTSADIDPSLADNRGAGTTDSITAVMSIDDINGATNGYLKNIATNDFANFPSSFDQENVILLLSTKGAAYTAKMKNEDLFTVEKDKPLLVSFFVKTSEVISGRSGASITLIDGENKTTISAFDSTTVSTVDIDDNNKDIYDGWVQCFFFVQNNTDKAKTFSLEFSLGPTAIKSNNTNKYSYGQGYAAFANFETKELTKTEYSYASTGDRAKKVTLTGVVEDSTVFDEADKVFNIEDGLANPQNFMGVLAGSKMLNSSGVKNEVPEGLLTGLLNYKHASNYGDVLGGISSKSGDEAWLELFGDTKNPAKVALQPLVIINSDQDNAKPSYGYFANEGTISASSYQKISLRVKLSKGAKATVYLTDTSEFGDYDHFLAPNAPKVTYWYDEDGNICKSDPTKKGFNKNTGLAFEIQTNGLYRKADSDDTSYYANLKSYNEKDGNLVLGDGTPAFYGNDGKFYAYRTENADGSFEYDVPVKDLYENGGKEIARYDFTKTQFPESVIEVDNTDGQTATDWITVTFYVHAGSETKNYRLEIWAGDREGNSTIPAGGYVFFDRYSSSTTSNYEKLLQDAERDLKDDVGMTLLDNGNLPEKDENDEALAYYYTFTFYDSVNYDRYDVNKDTNETGNLYASYDQSAYSEQLIYLRYDDLDGERTGIPSLNRFLDYSASDVEVTPDTPAADEDEEEETEREPISTGDILLIVSSSLLGVVLVFVIVMLLVRHFAGKRRRSPKSAAVKDNRYRPSEKKAAAPEAEEEENPFVKNRKAKEAAEKAKEAKAEPAETEQPVEAEPAPEAPAEEAEAPADEPAEENSESDNGEE